MNRFTQFMCSNMSNLTKIQQFEKQYSFDEFTQNKQKQRILNRLNRLRSIDYADSPEDIVLQQEEFERMSYALIRLRSELGVKNTQLLILRAGYRRKLKDIAKELGLSYTYVCTKYKAVKKQAREIVLQLMRENTVDVDMFQPIKNLYYATTPKDKLNYPFDSARNTFKKYHIYKGEYRESFHCKAIEYLDECFGDKKTICNYCGKQCTRLNDMEERI